jgi:hypothetical protein
MTAIQAARSFSTRQKLLFFGIVGYDELDGLERAGGDRRAAKGAKEREAKRPLSY